MNTTDDKAAKIVPPTILCITIFLCNLLKLRSCTFNLLSKIIILPTLCLTDLLFVSLPSSFSSCPPLISKSSLDPAFSPSFNLSHGSLCLLENSNRKKQLPLNPLNTKLIPTTQNPKPAKLSHLLLAPLPSVNALTRTTKKPNANDTNPKNVAKQIVSNVPLLTPSLTKFRCEHE